MEIVVKIEILFKNPTVVSKNKNSGKNPNCGTK